MTLSNATISLDHPQLLDSLAADNNLLVIQDLDGVCMELVQDPLTRCIDRHYVEAAHKLSGHFQVLTNGEHTGRRGVNRIVEQAFDTPEQVRQHGLYLPGLAAGGVQLQDRYGNVSHPGVTQAELNFLGLVPEKMRQFLTETLRAAPYRLDAATIDTLLQSAVLDNRVSPTINLNHFHSRFKNQPACYRQLQQQVGQSLVQLLDDAAARGLADAFFVHYAPNLGRDTAGHERLKPGDSDHAGTHDFQFMLRGAIKEVGTLVILNDYYQRRTGTYPLGAQFNARAAPRELDTLLKLAVDRFDPRYMPRILGVGDTVTACPQPTEDGRIQILRGGSDRGFLTLVQELGKSFDTDNVVAYVDSSGGEVQRPRIEAKQLHTSVAAPWAGLDNISDADDPLTLNFVFPEGYRQYVGFFRALADRFPSVGPGLSAANRATDKLRQGGR